MRVLASAKIRLTNKIFLVFRNGYYNFMYSPWRFFGSFLVTQINLLNAHARMYRGGGDLGTGADWPKTLAEEC